MGLPECCGANLSGNWKLFGFLFEVVHCVCCCHSQSGCFLRSSRTGSCVGLCGFTVIKSAMQISVLLLYLTNACEGDGILKSHLHTVAQELASASSPS